MPRAEAAPVLLGLVAAVASRGTLAAAVAWLAVLAAVQATDPGPALTAMPVTALALFPLGAWPGAALLHALDRGLRAVLVAALGRGRALLADVLTVLLGVAVAGVLGVLAAVLFDPAPPTVRDALPRAALHVVCGVAGVALALLLHACAVPRGVQAVVVLLGTFSGRLRWLPPEGPVLSTWGTGAPPGPTGTAVALGGAVVVAGLLRAAAALARRR